MLSILQVRPLGALQRRTRRRCRCRRRRRSPWLKSSRFRDQDAHFFPGRSSVSGIFSSSGWIRQVVQFPAVKKSRECIFSMKL